MGLQIGITRAHMNELKLNIMGKKGRYALKKKKTILKTKVRAASYFPPIQKNVASLPGERGCGAGTFHWKKSE